MHVSQTIEGLNNGNFIAEFDSWTPFSTIWISASWLTGHAIANKGHMQIPNNMHVRCHNGLLMGFLIGSTIFITKT